MNGEELREINNNKHRKIIIGGFILLFFILIGAAAYGIYILKFKKPSQITPPQVSISAPVSVGELTLIEEFELCQKVDYDKTSHYGEAGKDIFYKIAEIMAKRDEKVCSELGGDKDLCLSYYYKFLTLKENTSAYLDKLTLIGENNIIGRACLNQDASLCNEINSELEKSICRAVASLNSSHCNFTQKELPAGEVCLKVGDENGGIKKDCGVVNNQEAKSLCLNSYYAVKALKEKNINECLKIDNITGTFTRLNCLSLLSDNPKEEINKFYRENACYEKYATMVAEIKNDPAICEKIPLKDNYNKIEYENCISQFK